MKQAFRNFLDNLKMFISKHGNAFSIISLILFCYLFLFLNLGNYRLIDIDETRYVNIARAMFFNNNFITPYLNFEPFLEKPPLFYWLIILLYKLTGSIDEFISRIPTALSCTIMVFATYFFGKKALNSKVFGLISAFILLSNIWILLFSHIAIMDMGFTALCTLSIYCTIITLFDIKEKNKKYFWYLGYLFMGLSVLQKGLIGIIIPALVVGLTFLAFNKAKELIKPVNIIPGILIFFLIALPWHILAYIENGNTFFENYIIKHHFARFLNSSLGIERKQPFLFYIPIIFAGFLPWTFSFISSIIRGVKSLIKDFKVSKSFKQILSCDTNDRKLLVFASIYTIGIFIFFSISSTKLPTYILPIFPALSLITGYYWWGYIADNKFQKGVKNSTLTGAIFFILIGIGGVLAVNFLTGENLMYAENADGFRILMASWIIIIPLIMLLCLIAKNRALLFITHVILMLGVSIITSGKILNFVTTFGQTELENYAEKAQIVSDSKLVTLGFSRKYSLLNEYTNKIHYILKTDNKAYNTLENIKNEAKKENASVYLIIKKKKNYSDEFLYGFKKIQDGQKYDLYVY